MDNKESILDELTCFEKKKMKEMTPLLDDYLLKVAKTGDIIFPWSKLKPLILYKMEKVITEFHQDYPADHIPQCPNVEKFAYDIMREKLLEAVDGFTSAPFTIQRLCELVISPRQHYKRTDKFMRGLEKNVLVVSTIDPRNDNNQHQNDGENSVLVNGVEETTNHFKNGPVDIDSFNVAFPGKMPELTSPSSPNTADTSSDVVVSDKDPNSPLDVESCSSSECDVATEDEEPVEDQAMGTSTGDDQRVGTSEDLSVEASTQEDVGTSKITSNDENMDTSNISETETNTVDTSDVNNMSSAVYPVLSPVNGNQNVGTSLDFKPRTEGNQSVGSSEGSNDNNNVGTSENSQIHHNVDTSDNSENNFNVGTSEIPDNNNVGTSDNEGIGQNVGSSESVGTSESSEANNNVGTSENPNSTENIQEFTDNQSVGTSEGLTENVGTSQPSESHGVGSSFIQTSSSFDGASFVQEGPLVGTSFVSETQAAELPVVEQGADNPDTVEPARSDVEQQAAGDSAGEVEKYTEGEDSGMGDSGSSREVEGQECSDDGESMAMDTSENTASEGSSRQTVDSTESIVIDPVGVKEDPGLVEAEPKECGQESDSLEDKQAGGSESALVESSSDRVPEQVSTDSNQLDENQALGSVPESSTESHTEPSLVSTDAEHSETNESSEGHVSSSGSHPEPESDPEPEPMEQE